MAKSRRRNGSENYSRIVFRENTFVLLYAMIFLLACIAMYLSYKGIEVSGAWGFLSVAIGGLSVENFFSRKA